MIVEKVVGTFHRPWASAELSQSSNSFATSHIEPATLQALTRTSIYMSAYFHSPSPWCLFANKSPDTFSQEVGCHGGGGAVDR